MFVLFPLFYFSGFFLRLSLFLCDLIGCSLETVLLTGFQSFHGYQFDSNVTLAMLGNFCLSLKDHLVVVVVIGSGRGVGRLKVLVKSRERSGEWSIVAVQEL